MNIRAHTSACLETQRKGRKGRKRRGGVQLQVFSIWMLGLNSKCFSCVPHHLRCSLPPVTLPNCLIAKSCDFLEQNWWPWQWPGCDSFKLNSCDPIWAGNFWMLLVCWKNVSTVEWIEMNRNVCIYIYVNINIHVLLHTCLKQKGPLTFFHFLYIRIDRPGLSRLPSLPKPVAHLATKPTRTATLQGKPKRKFKGVERLGGIGKRKGSCNHTSENTWGNASKVSKTCQVTPFSYVWNGHSMSKHSVHCSWCIVVEK